MVFACALQGRAPCSCSVFTATVVTTATFLQTAARPLQDGGLSPEAVATSGRNGWNCTPFSVSSVKP